MNTVVRFAPDASGPLHVGNARMALINWLFASKAGGKFLLRFDDRDPATSPPELIIAIERDLMWLGLEWDEFARQSDRMDRYREAFDRLRAAGRIYGCYETAAELRKFSETRRAAGLRPIYDRAGLMLSDGQRRQFEAEGRKPHWRFLLDDGEVSWNDLVLGPQTLDVTNLSDPVVMRADGVFADILPSAVDDIDHGVTHVIRGVDHVTTPATQIQIFKALGAVAPALGHLPLIMDNAGHVISKEMGPTAIENLRGEGIEAMALNSVLANLGTGRSAAPCLSLSEIAEPFDIRDYTAGDPKLDTAKLARVNAKVLGLMPFEMVEKRLSRLDLEHANRHFWETVRTNLSGFSEVDEWYRVCFGDVPCVIEDLDLILTARELLPPDPWDGTTWAAWIKSVAAKSGQSADALTRALRLAVTGVDKGPDMQLLLPMIGRARALDRMGG
ncbi:MAG: glutamate--tRNA ligase [Rhodospirillales bacterium]|jgi:glutamyl-tRNA synthetase|nr:glutamate--tRNA ligase [Rhodospirillales bacterium]